jgi:hypothetical protein
VNHIDQLQARVETPAELGALLAAIEHAPLVASRLQALAQVRHGVITGEGPTTQGRVHFSRAIDGDDTALLRRILLAGGDEAVTRAEAEALFDIHEAALDRSDGGAFDDLFAKAIAHHVMAAGGQAVPARAVALKPTTPLDAWAAPVAGEVAVWLERRMRRKARNQGPLAAIAAVLLGAAPVAVSSLASVVDLAA